MVGYRLEKSLRLYLAGLRIRGLDPIAKTSELPDHSPRAPLFRLFGDGWAPFFVMNSLVQDFHSWKSKQTVYGYDYSKLVFVSRALVSRPSKSTRNEVH